MKKTGYAVAALACILLAIGAAENYIVLSVILGAAAFALAYFGGWTEIKRAPRSGKRDTPTL